MFKVQFCLNSLIVHCQGELYPGCVDKLPLLHLAWVEILTGRGVARVVLRQTWQHAILHHEQLGPGL